MKHLLEYWPAFYFGGIAVFCLCRSWSLHRRQKTVWKHDEWLCLTLREFNAPKRFNP